MAASLLSVHIAVEGLTDEYIVRAILRYVGLTCGLVRGREGKAGLLQQLPKYNQAARLAKWLVVVDLDQAACAPAYVQNILPQPSEGMCLRIAVRAIESWLLADREHLARFLGIAIDNVPLNPDLEINPKTTFIQLAQKCRQKALREDIAPRANSGAKVGPGYSGRINQFVNQSAYQWRPEIAVAHSDSLRRCVKALREWKLIGSQ